MKLIHVTPSISEEASGPTYSVRRLCDSLNALDHQTTLIAIGKTFDFAAPRSARLFKPDFGPRRLGCSGSMRRWLKIQCLQGDVDLVHNHGMWQFNALYPAWITRPLAIPLVSSPRGCFSPWAMNHGSRAKKLFWIAFQRSAMIASACFHATAESEYLDIRRLGFRQPVAVVPNGIDLPVLPPKTPTNLRTLLYLGRLHTVKGIPHLLHAWHAVHAEFPDWQLRIVGGDSDLNSCRGHPEALRAMAQSLGLPRVTFTGPLFGHEKFQAYRDADLYVLPSLSENFGVTVAESLACETPVIVSKGAPWKQVADHDAGWWIDIGTEPLRACLKVALATPRHRLQHMGRRGRAWMNRDFAWLSVANRLADVYKWLCNKEHALPKCIVLD